MNAFVCARGFGRINVNVCDTVVRWARYTDARTVTVSPMLDNIPFDWGGVGWARSLGLPFKSKLPDACALEYFLQYTTIFGTLAVCGLHIR